MRKSREGVAGVRWFLIMYVISAEPTEHGPNVRTEEHVSRYGCELALRELQLVRGLVARAWCKPEPVDDTQARHKPAPSPQIGMLADAVARSNEL